MYPTQPHTDRSDHLSAVRRPGQNALQLRDGGVFSFTAILLVVDSREVGRRPNGPEIGVPGC